LVIENLSFVIREDDSENFAKNAQFSGIALQRGKPQPKKLNRSKERKQRGKNFAKNAQFLLWKGNRRSTRNMSLLTELGLLIEPRTTK